MAKGAEQRIDPDDSNILRLFTNERYFADMADKQAQKPKSKENSVQTSRSALLRILKFLGLKRS